MTLFLLLSCGSGSANVEDPKSKFLQSVISLSNDFLNVFAKTLAFKAETTKNDIGVYFTKIAETITSVKNELQESVAKNENYSKVKSVEQFINTLGKIAEGAKTASDAIDSDDNPIANVAANNAGAAGTNVDKLVGGIKSIVDVVLGANEGKHDAGTDKKAEDGSTARTANAADGEAGKLFAAAAAGDANNAKKVAADAAKAVGAVTGADILKAIVKDGGDATKLATSNNAGVAPKDATIAGAIALRAMAKSGKFSGPNAADAADYDPAVKAAAVSAVTKALNTLTIAIRNTIDSGLKKINDALAAKDASTP
ncbi:variable large family protein [Candidatus Borrelia fainii]